MIDNFRRFQAGPDPFGDTWEVEFRWLQNAITIRHADAVDVKFFLRSGETLVEKVVGLYHPALLEVSKETGQELTDPWCMKLAALHVKKMIETGEDLEKTLVTPSKAEITEYALRLASALASRK
jgi:hypothetical protein